MSDFCHLLGGVHSLDIEVAGLDSATQSFPHVTQRRKGKQADYCTAKFLSADVLDCITSLLVAEVRTVDLYVRTEAESRPSTSEKGSPMIRPRFSIRTLAIVVTLVCAYFGAWEATKRYGVNEGQVIVGNVGQRGSFFTSEWSPAPLITSCLDHDVTVRDGGVVELRKINGWNYYIWLFGPKIKLPFRSEWHPS